MSSRTLLLAAGALAATAVPAAAATTRTVTLKDDSFSRTSLTVRTGDSVRFRWSGTRHPHDVEVDGPRDGSSGPAATSGSFRFRFTRRGTYKVRCIVHPGMRMTVRVT